MDEHAECLHQVAELIEAQVIRRDLIRKRAEPRDRSDDGKTFQEFFYCSEQTDDHGERLIRTIIGDLPVRGYLKFIFHNSLILKYS